jgi:hypothetical protein
VCHNEASTESAIHSSYRYDTPTKRYDKTSFRYDTSTKRYAQRALPYAAAVELNDQRHARDAGRYSLLIRPALLGHLLHYLVEVEARGLLPRR